MYFLNTLTENLKNLGATFVGFSDVTGKVPDKYSSLKYAITIGIRLSDFIIDEIGDAPTFTYFHHYRTVNSLIDQITLRATLMIQDEGCNALAIASSQTVYEGGIAYSGVFPHKTAAVLAGLGYIGKNALFISNDYGPRVRLGTILTDMKLPCNDVNAINGCGECNTCVKACPAMAIKGQTWKEGTERSELIDAKACSDYMNAKFKQIGRGSVCGICIKVCPKRKK